MRRKCVPLSRKSGSKRQNHVPFIKKCVENAYPRAEIGCLGLPVPGQTLEFWGAILNPLSLLLLYYYYYNTPARRHKLRCLFLSVLIFVRASAPCLANFDPRPTGGRADGRAPAAPDGRTGACGARSTERLRRSLTARLRRECLVPKTIYVCPRFTLPVHRPNAYEGKSARHGGKRKLLDV